MMANLSSCDSDVLSEVPYSDTYLNDMINQEVQEMPYSKQTHIDDFQDNEINSDSNIISYSQYLQESQDAVIQDTNSYAPNDLLVLSLVEQMTDYVANLDKENQTNKMVKEKESLSTTLTVFKTECKEKESKYMDKEIVLENQNKELENTLSLGYQNAFYLKKAQRIQPTLYDGSVIAKEHNVISVIDDEETLILEEESRSKMLDKQNDPISIKQKINISPIDYSKLNKIKEDFDKRFVTQKELSTEQACWLKHTNYNPDTSVKSHTPVRIEAPSELSKVMKKRTISDVITASVWGFEHTKACSVTEIIPFLKVLKDTFNAFDKTLLDEVTEVQTVFNQMKTAVDQCSIDKNDFEIQINQLNIDNDQLLKQIMSQKIVHIAMNSMDILNVNKSCVDECNKCQELEIELLKKKDLIEKDVYDKLLKNSVENVKKDIDEIEMINIELEHNVAKLLSENENLRKEREHLKSIYKDQFDLIRKIRIQSKEHCDSLIAQINAKSIENSNLNAQLQEKIFAIAALKNELRKLKGKNIVDTAVSKPSATIAPGMFKLDIEPISHRLKNNRDAHEVYLEKTIENTDTIRELELLVYVSKTCSSLTKPCEKLVAVTPMNKDKKVRFAEPVTSSSNIPKQTDSLKTKDSNKPLLTSIGVKPTTSASGSKPSGNTTNNRITYTSTVRFGIDHIAKIIGYGDYQMGNVTISRVYYVEGLGCALMQRGKVENATTEMLRSLDQLMERKEGGGMYLLWAPLIGDVRTLMMDEAHASRSWWKIYFAALVDIVEGIENTAKTCIRLIILKRTEKYLADTNLHVHLEEIKVNKTLRFAEEPVEIIDREVKSLKRSRIPIVKSIGTRSEVMRIS
ncbi:hypothetical protein Tco_0840835 [Tanacetum coccineum]|uniref:Integrase, catalytic region, zinc finger, CCHC-type, peptidase aspartic, catalytic n=1 Tax=Tanacetum coccineum TaxID=301880 RepID=A0ABQ5AY79_9ASTR